MSLISMHLLVLSPKKKVFITEIPRTLNVRTKDPFPYQR